MRKADYENMKRVILAMMEARAGNGLGECKFEEMEGVARRLHRIEATLKRLATMFCDSRTFGAAERERQKRLEALVVEIVQGATGCVCHCEDDPRGACIRMHLPKFHNSWDGETTILNW